PNSVPFYLSSAGYGVFRNTYAPNTYAFTDPVTTSAKEQRFDAYYFAGEGADAACAMRRAAHKIGDPVRRGLALTSRPEVASGGGFR
ncbi:hypothetical protein ACFVRU_55895, partial [Streptomyces sp. NPDC057927]